MWADIQETFYIIFGPFIVYTLLPLFVGVGILVAFLMAFQRVWRPLQVVKAKIVAMLGSDY